MRASPSMPSLSRFCGIPARVDGGSLSASSKPASCALGIRRGSTASLAAGLRGVDQGKCAGCVEDGMSPPSHAARAR